jgi:hypothetical protein
MKLGILYDFHNPPRNEWFTPWPQFYAGAFAHMQEMERLSFDAVSLAEHHGDPEGYNPGMAVTLAAAAMRARRVRICSNIIQLPRTVIWQRRRCIPPHPTGGQDRAEMTTCRRPLPGVHADRTATRR